MSIQSIGGRNAVEVMKNMTSNKAVEKSNEEITNKTDSTAVKSDTYSKQDSTSAEKLTYQEPKKLSLDELRKINDQRLESFKKVLSQMFSTQANKAGNKSFSLNIDISININISNSTSVSDPTAEGGEWSSDAVSKRIIDMAKALSGGDKSKISLLKDAVEKGFGAATKAWGGELPGVCGETHDKVMKAFDEWENEGKTSTDTE